MSNATIRVEALRLAMQIKPMEYTEGGELDHRWQQLGGSAHYTPKVRKGGWTPDELIAAAEKIEAWITRDDAPAKPARKGKPSRK